MVALPETTSPTVEAIYRFYEEKDARTPPRPHLGASVIGKECARALWYGFRWCGKPQFTGRLLRLFETGQREEARVVANLRAIGVTVHEVDPNTGRQFLFLAHGGHFGGSLDGALLGIPEAPKTWHLLEIKTHNAKSFAELKAKGVQEAKPQHWHQMQTYMGMGELTRALYFAVNKDTDELHIERVRYEPRVYRANIDKALRVIEAAEPLTRLADDPESFACKWCEHTAICHQGKVPSAHCRTCAHVTPITKGQGARWKCERHNKLLSTVDQLNGCDEHLFIPVLVAFAQPVDADDDWVAYQIGGREQYFINCAASGFPAIDVPHYSSKEISALNPAVIGHPIIEAARKIFDGEVVG